MIALTHKRIAVIDSLQGTATPAQRAALKP